MNNILRMAREGLHADLAIGLHEALATGAGVVRRGLRIEAPGGDLGFDLSIRPMPPEVAGQPLFLVVLEARGPAPTPEGADPAEGAGDREARIERLTRELRAKEAYLQAANEELETSNEELRSSNEELQSVNEELQSTNEELETSKEELQSVNEELATVNAELQAKVLDLSQVNNDMNNLLAGTGIGTVFVDHQLRILRFTPAATQIINLIPGDVGRPVGHLVSNLEGYDRMLEDVQEVLDTLVPRETEVRSREGGTYAMRIQPYRTLENVIEGAVLTFVDISREKRIQVALMESERRFRVLLDQAPMAALVVREGRIQFVNQAGLDLLGLTDAGQVVDRPLDTCLVQGAPEDPDGQMRGEVLSRDGRRRWVDVRGAAVPFPDGEARIIFLGARSGQDS